MEIKEYNRSKDSEYHSQINNKVASIAACGPTSMIMALKQSGYEIPDTWFEQEEDGLMSLLRTKEAFQYMRDHFPWAEPQGFKPNEVHGCLSHFTNQMMGREVTSFSTHDTVSHILSHVVIGERGAVVSGAFDLGDGRVLHHMVSVAGMEYRGELRGTVDLGRVVSVIIDDPYGDYRTGYSSSRGNDVKMPVKEFIGTMKKTGAPEEKWAHLIW